MAIKLIIVHDEIISCWIAQNMENIGLVVRALCEILEERVEKLFKKSFKNFY